MLSHSEIQRANTITTHAGKLLREFFDDPEYRKSQPKKDGSPVTRADQEVSAYLIEQLGTLGYPVVSEEDELKEGLQEPYFIVDPLDGTKHFARGEHDFCVLVGFIVGQASVFGSIFAPMTGDQLYASKGGGAFFNGQKMTPPQNPPMTAVVSGGDHPKIRWVKDELGIQTVDARGSALKFCDIALGRAVIYPRHGNTCEWDTAAGQVLLEELGCHLLDIRDGQPLRYGKPQRLNKGFVAYHGLVDEKVRKLIAEKL